jgi:hypothetical protein
MEDLMTSEPGYRLWWNGGGFGEPLMAALMTSVLNDNKINAVFQEHRGVKNLVNCSLYNPDSEIHQTYKRFRWRYEHVKKPIILQMIDYFQKRTGRTIKLFRNCIPVKFYDIPSIPSVDVVMCTQAGTWSPYRNWPYFDELKGFLNREKISFVDLNAEKIRGIECLNYVQKSKLYLGLDTGTSHYVSQFANGKTLILQGGFIEFDFWAHLYDYECMQMDDIQCRPCFINKRDITAGNGCKYDNMCMQEISVERVFTRIMQRLN